MKEALLLIHITFALSLMGLILLQSSKGGLTGGLSAGSMYRSKRGAERIIFIATIIFAVLFFLTSVLTLLIR